MWLMNDLAFLEYTNDMSKHKSHVDRKRNANGNAVTKMRLSKMERMNKSAPLVEYNIDNFTGKFEIYDPNKKKGRKNNVYI
ncbi:MAG: hypothetical protein PHF87_03970 [Desulfotomaculaceae bacterium]|nr:hypothetical protein [Desulfotomaculaceae bacterium]